MDEDESWRIWAGLRAESGGDVTGGDVTGGDVTGGSSVPRAKRS